MQNTSVTIHVPDSDSITGISTSDNAAQMGVVPPIQNTSVTSHVPDSDSITGISTSDNTAQMGVVPPMQNTSVTSHVPDSDSITGINTSDIWFGLIMVGFLQDVVALFVLIYFVKEMTKM